MRWRSAASSARASSPWPSPTRWRWSRRPASTCSRQAALTGRVGYAESFPAVCASACTIILAGGVERYASPDSYLGVHQIKRRMTQTFVRRQYLVRYRIVDGRREEISRKEVSETRNSVTTTDVDPASVNARVAAYFKQMGEDNELMALMETASPDKMHRMTLDEARRTRLVTILMDRREAMETQAPESGLAGSPADSAAVSRLEADGRWPLEPDKDGGPRAFTAHFELRRGGAGVAATFAVLEAAPAPLLYGVRPDAPSLWRDFAYDARRMNVFLPNALFCRSARVGELFVVRAEPSPTFSPGLPDPEAPLLRAPWAASTACRL